MLLCSTYQQELAELDLRQVTIPIRKNIHTSYSSHTELSLLANKLEKLEGILEIMLDFSEVTFIASNLQNI